MKIKETISLQRLEKSCPHSSVGDVDVDLAEEHVLDVVNQEGVEGAVGAVTLLLENHCQ